MICVVDTSIVVKFYVEEEGHEQALTLLASAERLLAPSMLLAEFGNVLWKKTRLGEIRAEQAETATSDLRDDLVEIVPLEELHDHALALCLTLNHPIYDCYYLALAEREGLPLATSDRRLLAIAKDGGWPLQDLST